MYIPESFSVENNKHTESINALKKYFYGSALINELPGKNDRGFDLEMVFREDLHTVFNIEIKTNTGCSSTGFNYPTWIIETWADNEMYKLPEWRTTKDLHYLIIFNRATKHAYIYNIEKLRSYVIKNESRQVSSGVGTGQYGKADKKCSWGLKINWNCPEAGCESVLDLKDYW